MFLMFNSKRLGDVDVCALVSAVLDPRSDLQIESLNLSNNYLGDDAAFALSDLLKVN